MDLAEGLDRDKIKGGEKAICVTGLAKIFPGLRAQQEKCHL